MLKIYRLIGLLAVLGMLALAGCAGSETSRSTGGYLDDKTISTKVEAKLAGDSLTQAIQVDVETYNGVVQLSGFVDKEETIQRAEDLARSVQGVKEVKNNLVLRQN
jgi:osmotically-inducible protein OsmY